MIDPLRWRRRSLAALVSWLVGWAATAALGAHPQPVLLALATAAVFAVVGAAVDVREFVDQADWVPPHRARPRQLGLDPRFSRLSQSFNDGTDPQVVAERVHETLVRVVDDILASRHGIDRERDPQAARQVLGDEVAHYLDQPPHYRRSRFQRMPSLLTRIESL